MRRALFVLVAAWLFVALPLRTARAEEEPEKVPRDVPVHVKATLDESEAAITGWLRLDLEFEVLEDVPRPYRVELRLRHAVSDVLNLDHIPDPPTGQWKKGQRIRYSVPVPLPLEQGLDAEDNLRLELGFYDPRAKAQIPPRAEDAPLGSRITVARFEMPTMPPADEPEVLEGILAHATRLAAAGRKPDAWSALDVGIRRAAEDETKYRFRDAMTALGHFDARPLSRFEKAIVKSRIQAEQQRYWRKMAGRYFDRKQYFAAIRILEQVGGQLSEAEGEAVIGAVADAKRAQKDIADIKMRILSAISDEERAEAQAFIDSTADGKVLYEKAQKWMSEGKNAMARYVLRELSITGEGEWKGKAREGLDELEKRWLAATPPEEAELVKAVVEHPAFGRLDTAVSHNFIFIGPRVLVKGIPAKSRLRFDISFIFLTDLFGRRPNPGGDRVTVFFKELWDFGGGQGGGKIIDIGRAKPDRQGLRVDTGLYYHELTHCVDDTNPILAGFREGLANMGAAYCFEALGQQGDSLHSFTSNLSAFQHDYVNRDLPYWRIPGYGPSAGFFLHFVNTHSRRGKLHDWKPYRQFFREYRHAPIRDGREPYVARALAYYLIRAFGMKAFDDLMRFRFPLVTSDRKAVKLEMEAFAKGHGEFRAEPEELDDFPNSPLRRDLIARRMIRLMRQRGKDDEVKRISQERLGIIHDWHVIGPFNARGADPLSCVLPPEREIDFTKEYPGGDNICRWRKAGDVMLVAIDPMGWVSFNFNYMDNTATYGLTHVTVPLDTDAMIHVRMDDDFSLFVNDKLVDRYRNRGANASSQLWWRGPYERAPDAMRLPVTLKAGRNKILVKVKNRWGKAGFILAVSHMDGRPIDGLKADTDPPTESHSVALPKVGWKSILKHSFRKKAFKSKLEVAVGKFEVKGDLMRGVSKDKRVGWRKYTVRPGFPKDAPSNLAWIKSKYTDELDAFRLTMGLAQNGGGVPKLVVTFQGEGKDDGLSGWNLIVHPKGKGRVAARLERYDNVVYQVQPIKLEKQEIHLLVLEYREGRFTATIAGKPLFEDVPINPIPGKRRIGFATYGPNLAIADIRLDRIKPR